MDGLDGSENMGDLEDMVKEHNIERANIDDQEKAVDISPDNASMGGEGKQVDNNERGSPSSLVKSIKQF